MKLNEMHCPSCGHVTYDEAAYTRCDACGTTFYASQSRRPLPVAPPTHVPIPGIALFAPSGQPIWISPTTTWGGAGGTCSPGTCGTVITT